MCCSDSYDDFFVELGPKVLFLLGNGFDRFHGMSTSYSDFEDYLDSKNDGFPNALVSHLDPCLKPDWSNFEDAIGDLDVATLQEASFRAVEKSDTDDDYDSGTSDGMDDWLEGELGYIRILPEKLRGWAENIPPAKKKMFHNLNLPYARFFTFNYTDTLEQIYGISDSQIWHVHGRASNTDEPLVIGSFNSGRIVEAENQLNLVPELDSKMQTFWDSVLQYYDETEKDVNANLANNAFQFKDLGSVSLLVIIGFSFGRVDLPYLRQIAETAPKIQKVVITSHANEKSKDPGNEAMLWKQKIDRILQDNDIHFSSIDFLKTEELSSKLKSYLKDYASF
jgi:hypothetical protein